MKSLVVYYSRTGTTKKVAKKIAGMLGSDIEEIIDTKKRGGPFGFMIAVKDGGQRKMTTIKEPEKDPSEYDIIIIGTPIWAGAMTPAIRTYISEKKDGFPGIALFCTHGGRDKGFLGNMEEFIGLKAVALMALQQKDVQEGNVEEPVEKFVDVIQSSSEMNEMK